MVLSGYGSMGLGVGESLTGILYIFAELFGYGRGISEAGGGSHICCGIVSLSVQYKWGIGAVGLVLTFLLYRSACFVWDLGTDTKRLTVHWRDLSSRVGFRGPRNWDIWKGSGEADLTLGLDLGVVLHGP